MPPGNCFRATPALTSMPPPRDHDKYLPTVTSQQTACSEVNRPTAVYTNADTISSLFAYIRCMFQLGYFTEVMMIIFIHHSKRQHNNNKKHSKNVGPIRHNEPPHAHSADVASGTVARRLHINVYDDDDDDDNDNA